MSVQLGVILHVLAKYAEEDLRNEKADVRQGSLLLDRGPYLADELLDVVPLDHLLRQAESVSLFCCYHFFVLPYLRFDRFGVLVALLGCKVSFELADLFLQCSDRVVVCGSFRVECINLVGHGCLFLFCLRFRNGCFELGLSGLELCGLCLQRFELLFLGVNLFPEHQCFECHF